MKGTANPHEETTAWRRHVEVLEKGQRISPKMVPVDNRPAVGTEGTRRPADEALETGEVAGARLDRCSADPDPHVDAVPAVFRDSLRRVAHQVALTELLEHTDEDKPQIIGLPGREE